MFRRILMLTAALAACNAFAQSTAMSNPGRLTQVREPAKEASISVAAVSGPSIEVRKSAFVDGAEVRGVITIKNTGRETVTVTEIIDYLEVHFPRGVEPPAHLVGLDGSTPGWFKVADITNLGLPGPIAPRATATIEYGFPLCSAEDYAGANSMRNVVTVRVTNASGGTRTVTTRSVSFPPPVLDCQACCLPDGSCTDTVPDDCAADGGTSDGTGTACTTIQCCFPLGTSGCTNPADCCDTNAFCNDGNATCCIPSGVTGCTGTSDCCSEPDICESGKCCAPTGAADSCFIDSDCCDPNATCNGGTCCVGPETTGCEDDADCCDYFGVFTLGCEAGTGRCCNVIGGSCNANEHCCDPNATCELSRHVCCIHPPDSGCTFDSDCCFLTCNSGKCCGRLGDFCNTGTDNYCCNTNAICGSENVCCLPQFRSGCSTDSDCCSGLVCTSGLCEGVFGP